MVSKLRVVALAGGVGGAKLAQGLAQVHAPGLSVVVNTGDDFEHLGLTICPDLDTVLYTLAGEANPRTGWGLRGESFACLEALDRLGGPTWFRLGDRDLATHLLRTQWLREGARLTEVTHRLAGALEVQVPILPMTDAPFRTQVLTDEGEMPFQEYFVHRRWEPAVRGFRWEGEGRARPTPEVKGALQEADLVVICPSNPFVSIGPILALPGVREALASRVTVAVSPILGGEAVKGPAAKMYRELGMQPSALAVARHYDDLLTGFVLDEVDADLKLAIEELGLVVHVTDTLMPGLEERIRVAREVLTFASTLQ
jgi:LPPG:FO 2-phospho-L-lactate transferase